MKQEIIINKVKLNDNNPRTINEDKFKQLVQSIKDFPQMLEKRPIVVDETMTVLGGNMRLKACKEAGLKKVWIEIADDWTEAQKREFIIKDNVSFGQWDWDILANEWDEVELSDWGLEVESSTESHEVVEDDYEEPDDLKVDVVLGDLIEIGNHRLLCGDSTKKEDVEKLMNGEKADLLLTDPPYNVNYGKDPAPARNKREEIKNDQFNNSEAFYRFLHKSFFNAKKHLKKGAAYYVFYANSETVNFWNAVNEGLDKIQQQLTWVKNTILISFLDYHYRHEPILYGWICGGKKLLDTGSNQGKNHYFTTDRTKSTVFEDSIDLKKLKKDELLKMVKEMLSPKTSTSVINVDKPVKSPEHPTMKPLLLLAELIQNSSRKKETVLDIFLGSGSTMAAAHQLDRKCYGIELDPKYCQVIIDRMKKLDESIEVKINGVKYKNG